MYPEKHITLETSDLETSIPKISIIVPSLNQGQYLRQCINSILSQRYSNLELIVIDGGSQDRSVDIISEYSDSIDYWVSEPDSGQSNAINKGFKRATGTLVAWLNSDDYYLPNAFADVLATYKSCPDASFYFGNGFRVDANGKKKERFFERDQFFFDRNVLLYGLNYILQPSTFISARYLQKINYLDESLHYGMDSDLWMRLSKEVSPVPIFSCLAASREYGETKTSTGSFKRTEELRSIAHRHTGMEMTPGALCYFLDTLSQFSKTHEDVFSSEFSEQVTALWVESQKVLERFGSDSTGFPSFENTADQLFERSIAFKMDVRERPRIGIDLRNIVMGQSGGIAQLIKGIFREVFLKNPTFDYVVFSTIFSRGLLLSDADNVQFLTLPLDNYYAELDRISQKYRLSLLFRGYPVVSSSTFPLSRQIFLIPDIQHETFPQFFTPQVLRDRRQAFDQALSSAGAIATISEYARKTLAQYPQTRCKEIFLTPPALQTEHAEGQGNEPLSAEVTEILNRKYFLYPANLWPHKNHRRLLQAFSQLVGEIEESICLVLTGSQQDWAELKKEFSHIPVIHLGFVSAQSLRALYRHAIALAFFSLYEGFGIPLLEAFNSGTPVICSNTTSLPEVGGDAVLSCDPTNIEEISQLMKTVLSDESLRESLSTKGYRRLSYYSWQRSADSLESAFRRLIDSADTTDWFEYFEKDDSDIKPSDMPLVSIITPSFNQGRFIKRTIDSVLSQSYPNIEYVVIDGGSSDETLDVLKSYGDRLRWISEPDNGQTNAINKGLQLTSGSIQAYLNSDDVLLPDAVATAVNYFNRHSNCDVVYGKANYIDAEDQVTGQYNTADYSFERLMQDCCICQPATFWRTSLAETIGPFNEQLNYVMDYEYWLRAAHAGAKIRYVQDFLANSRLYMETKTLSAREDIYREVFQVCMSLSGYISLGYVQGLWHHLCYEKQSGLPAKLSIVPKVDQAITFFHYKWLNRRKYTSAYLRIRLKEKAKPKIYALAKRSRLMKPLKALRRIKALANPQQSVSPIKSVNGFGLDNWMSPVCTVALTKPYREGRLYLSGTTPISMSLSIYANGKSVNQFGLQANRYETIEFDLVFDQPQQIKFVFSDSFCDRHNRKLSFLLQDTNLLLEKDLF